MIKGLADNLCMDDEDVDRIVITYDMERGGELLLATEIVLSILSYLPKDVNVYVKPKERPDLFA